MESIFNTISNYKIIKLSLFVIPMIIFIIFCEKSKYNTRKEIKSVLSRKLPDKWYDKIFRWAGGREYESKEFNSHLAKKQGELAPLESKVKFITGLEITLFVIWLILFFIFDLRFRIF